MRRVLFGHQSTIPHYRVPFYNALERMRPNDWRFEVVFDPQELNRRLFFREALDTRDFQFSVLEVKTLSVMLGGKRISYQSFFSRAADYDLVIVENALNNLAYPLCHLHQLTGVKVAHWGHGKDRGVGTPSLAKLLSEKMKQFLTLRADGFFAYTRGVKDYLLGLGVPSERVFVVNNTIDIRRQRCAYEKWFPRRDTVRQKLDLQDKDVLLFVGRFTSNKRVDFLLEAFAELLYVRPSARLLLVGSGGERYGVDDLPEVVYFGPLVELAQLAPLYVASDLFVFPGSVGLGPLQALCYGIPVVTIDSTMHMPEIEYLTPDNSITLDSEAKPKAYAAALAELLADDQRLADMKARTWPSIRHLTIENMAHSFMEGIDTIIGS